ncbi:MAG: StPS1 [Polaromonas sp.]|nr:StPS1 [Polaromonas sp.]
MANVFDRLVGVFNPDKALRLMRSRELLKRAYEGASVRDGWRPKRPGASPNTDHAADGASLRARSRALDQNVPYMAQGLRSLVAAVVGTGIVPNWTGPDAKIYNEAWAEMVPSLDADGRLDAYGMQSAAYEAMERDGEVLVRIRPRRLSDGLKVPIQFQLLEIDWLDSGKSQVNGANTIVNGVEYDVLGKVAGYWLYDQHPGEMTSFRSRKVSSSFVPVEKIIHLFTPHRPGQGRGFPRASPVIARVRDLQLYEDAELQRKNLETRLSVLASGDVSELANAPPGLTNGEAVAQAKETGNLGQLASGGITQVPTGMNLTLVEPKAAAGYVEYMKFNLHIIAAGFGVTYEMMTGDGSDTNFSSARGLTLNFRREAEVTQWNLLIPRLCDRMCREFANACELAGLVKKANYQIEHATPKWDYVNPAQDVGADLEEVAGGLSSLSEKLRRRGYKPEAVFKEIASDFETLKRLGVLDVMLMLQKGRQMGDGAPPEPTPKKKVD